MRAGGVIDGDVMPLRQEHPPVCPLHHLLRTPYRRKWAFFLERTAPADVLWRNKK